MKNNKGFAPIFVALIVVGALIIGGGAFWLGKNQTVKSNEIRPEEKNVDKNYSNYKENIKTNNNSDYSTYLDQTNGFKFDYLKNRFVESADYFSVTNSKEDSYYYNKKGIYISDCTGEDPNCITSSLSFSVYVKDNITNTKDLKSYLEWEIKYQDRSDSCGVTPALWSNNTKINGQNTIQVNRSICVAAGYGEKYPLPLLGTIYNNKAYIIGFEEGEYVGNEKTEFDNLVSSFKFLDSESTSLEKDVTNQPAYLKSVYKKDGKNYISVDYIQMFETREERIKAMIDDKECSNIVDCYDFPNGYKRNTNPLVRVFEIDSNAVINVYGEYNQDLNNGNLDSSKTLITFDQLKSFNDKRGESYEQYVIINVKNNKVIKLSEPYQE